MLVRLDEKITVAPCAVAMLDTSKEGWMNVHLKDGRIIYVDKNRAAQVRADLERRG